MRYLLIVLALGLFLAACSSDDKSAATAVDELNPNGNLVETPPGNGLPADLVPPQ